MPAKKEGRLMEIALALIYPNLNQPRKAFDPAKLEELAQSIREYGVLEPIILTPRGKRYMIIAGERRFRASELAELATVPARVIEADDALVEELALLENIQRQDLTPIEEARAFQSLLNRGWSKAEFALKMGFKQTWRVDERTSLLRLLPEYQELVAKGEITNSVAFEMSRLDPEGQSAVLMRVRSGQLGNYNRLRAFVDGVIASANQGAIFELKSLSADEARSIRNLESMVSGVESLLSALHEGKCLAHLRKTAFHSGVNPERLDLIIRGLQRIRKEVLSGSGTKEALSAA